MKKIIGLLLLIAQFSCGPQSNDSINFTIEFKPSHTYEQTTEQRTHSESNITGSADFLKSIQEEGIKNPIIRDAEQITKLRITTSGLKSRDEFLITCDILKVTAKGQEADLPIGTKFYGHCRETEMPIFDSLSLIGLSDEAKNSALQRISKILSQVSFKDKKLKIGEEFTTETPIEIPMGEQRVLKISMEQTYKLKSIDKDIATFDISIKYILKDKEINQESTYNAEGTGKILYDIHNNFYRHFEMTAKMIQKIKEENYTIVTTNTVNSIQNTRIVAH